MPILSKPANAAYLAITYITVGALFDVWTLVWYLYLRHGGYDGPLYYVCGGFALTGLTLLLIGFSLGQIGRSARNAELPPKEAMPASAVSEQTAAAHPPVVLAAAPPAVPGNAAVPPAAGAPPIATAPPVAKLVQ